jgi:hypothetical protein
MAYTQYTAKGMSEKEKEHLKILGLDFINPTLDQNRLEYFVFVKIKSYDVRTFGRYIYPEKPYLEIEYWKDGKKLTEKAVHKLDPELKNINPII